MTIKKRLLILKMNTIKWARGKYSFPDLGEWKLWEDFYKKLKKSIKK